MALFATVFKRFRRNNQSSMLIINVLFLFLSTVSFLCFQNISGEYFNSNTIVVTTEVIGAVISSWILLSNFFLNNFAIVSITSVVKYLLSLGVSTLIYHAIAVLYGAPFFRSALETFCFAALLTSVTTLPCLCVLGRDVNKWGRVFLHHSPENAAETSVHITSLFSILGAWLGAFPIPLDWDRPWQVWPISCVIGTIMGYVLGIFVATVHLTLLKWKDNKVKLR